MENIKKENHLAELNEKTDADQYKAEKDAKQKASEINADNDNGFISPSTEESSNKGQGPAGEDL